MFLNSSSTVVQGLSFNRKEEKINKNLQKIIFYLKPKLILNTWDQYLQQQLMDNTELMDQQS